MTTPNAPDDAHSPDDAHGMEHQISSDSSSRYDGPRPGQPRDLPPTTDKAAGGSGDGESPFGAPAGGEPVTGETLDEAALRDLMHNAVQGLKASPDALDHLRRAIPARRQHRRQALAGAAAAVLLAGMAVPALLKATHTADSTGAAPQNVASSHAAAPGEDGHTNAWSGAGDPAGHSSTAPGSGPHHQPSAGSGGNGTSGATATPPTTDPAAVPDCTSAQLGQGASQAAAPDSQGRVYGWFRVTNISADACSVSSGGTVQALAEGSADQSRIQVQDHTSGDPATELPDTTPAGPVVLKPGDGYQVDFAWVPAADGPGGCPTPSSPPASPTPTPTPTSTTSPGTDTGSDAAAGSAQSGTDTPVSAPPGSIALNHTPAAGAPVVAGPTLQDACAGTVYTTTALPEQTGTGTPGS